MSGYIYQYITVIVKDLIFFHDDVQSTTIAVAVAGSLCCSIVWAICHLVNIGPPCKSAGQKPHRTLQVSNVTKVRKRSRPTQSTSSEDDGAYDDDEKTDVDVPCVQCGSYIADYTCRFVTCNMCCFAPSSCVTHQKTKRNRRPYSARKKGATEINLSSTDIQKCPDRLGYVGFQLTLLNLSHNNLHELPPEIGCLRGLQELIVHKNEIMSIPDSIGSLVSLKVLKFSHNHLKCFPDSLVGLSNLTHLDARHNNLECLPLRLGELYSLAVLKLGSNSLQFLPLSLYQLKNLKVLKLEKNKIEVLSDEIRNLIQLQHLNVSGCHLSHLPAQIGSCSSLQKLILSNNRLRELPIHIGQLCHLTTLDVANNKLLYIPSILHVDCIPVLNGNNFVTKEHSLGFCNHIVLRVPPLLELSAYVFIKRQQCSTQDLPQLLQVMIADRKYCEQCFGPCFVAFQSKITFCDVGDLSIPVLSVRCIKCQE